MDIPSRRNGQNDSDRVKLVRDDSDQFLSSSINKDDKLHNYYGSTPASLRIPNVNSITDLNEVNRAINSYNSTYDDDSTELPTRRLSQMAHGIKRPFKNSNTNGESSNNEALFRMDSEASTSSHHHHHPNRQLTQSNKTTSTRSTRQMNNFMSTNSGHFGNSQNGGDTNSLYHFMRQQTNNHKVQIYESLDYEINENVLYLMEKKRSLRSKQNRSPFCKLLNIGKFFTTPKEFSRWFIIFLIGVFTALTASFIMVAVDSLSEQKYEHLQSLFNFYLSNNHLHNSSRPTLNSTYNSTDSLSFDTLSFDKSQIRDKLFKLQIPLLFWFLTNAVPVLFGSALVTYLGIYNSYN